MKITVFDWDDTLFPTFYAYKNELIVMTDEERKQLRTSIEIIFRKAKIYSDKIFIITNATKGWVEWCIEYLYEDDGLFENYFLLEDIEIISIPENVSMASVPFPYRKIAGFGQLIPLLIGTPAGSVNTLISFGDTEFDRNASVEMRNFFSTYYGKSFKTPEGKEINVNSKLNVINVKMVENVSFDFLLKEHKFIINNFNRIYNMKNHYDKIIIDESSLMISCNDLYPNQEKEYVIIHINS
jgi:hypothetical protein